MNSNNNIGKGCEIMNKSEAFKEINKLQDEYVDELIRLIKSSDYDSMKAISFTSATGTGKTKMMSKLIDKLPNYYYVVTTLSKGQLHLQIKESLANDCNNKNNNYINPFLFHGIANKYFNINLFRHVQNKNRTGKRKIHFLRPTPNFRLSLPYFTPVITLFYLCYISGATPVITDRLPLLRLL